MNIVVKAKIVGISGEIVNNSMDMDRTLIL